MMTAVSRGIVDQSVVLSIQLLLVLYDSYDDCGASGMADQLVVLSSLFLYFLTAMTFSPASVCDRYDDCGVSGVADQLVVLS